MRFFQAMQMFLYVTCNPVGLECVNTIKLVFKTKLTVYLQGLTELVLFVGSAHNFSIGTIIRNINFWFLQI